MHGRLWDAAGKEPRYLQIAHQLATDIAAQRWALGQRMPPEPELAAAFHVSRETLRNALRRVESWGLISRRKGDGTRVERLTPKERFDTSLSNLNELVQYGRDAVREICATDDITAEPELAAAIGLPPGTPLCRLTTIRRSADGSPVAWTRIYLHPDDAATIAVDLAHGTRLISDLISERAGRTTHRVVQRVRAIALPPEAAAALGLEAGGPALEFVRRYYDAADQLLEVTIGVHPGETFSYTTTLMRSTTS